MKPITLTGPENASLVAALKMAQDTFERKAKDPKNPEGVQKIFHTARAEAKALEEKLLAHV